MRPLQSAGWNNPAGNETYELEVASLQEMLDRGAEVTILDVRPTAERAEWYIPGSVHRDAYEALRAGNAEALADVAFDKKVPVVVVCAMGRTSAIAAALLRQRGYEAFSLNGGMKAWSLAWNTAELSSSDASLVQVRRTGKGCLSYVLASGTVAVVVDASLDPDVYLRIVSDRGWRIRHVVDTHIHADHLSRSRALAATAGSTLWLPEQRRVRFAHRILGDGAELSFGRTRLRALHTPGHTLESMSYLVDERWLLTGDTLFLSAVGRPDLEATADKARGRALLLHASLVRLFALDSRLLVLPSHTSAPVPFDHKVVGSPLGAVRDAIPLPADAAAFAMSVLGRIPQTPPNHHAIVSSNEAGELPPSDPTDLEAGANRCAVS
jgi:glyoxylase-like metal-dependent hydrolase (beta-lactamase superfamily II)